MDKRPIVLAVTLAITFNSVPCFAADPWTESDSWKQVAYTTLLAIDCAQTSYEIGHPGRTREGNPLIGPYPSKGKINNICLATGLGHFGISYVLPAKLRSDWQWSTIVIEAFVVRNNYMVGAKIGF